MSITTAVDIHRVSVGDRLDFDGNPTVFSPSGHVLDFVGGDILAFKKFDTTSSIGGVPVGIMPFDSSLYDHDILAYDITITSGTPGLTITTPQFTEGEYYLVLIDTSGLPLSGSRTIVSASIIYIAHKEIPIIGGAVAGVDLDAIKRMISLMGAGVKIRKHQFENGFLKSNEVAVFDFDTASSMSLDLQDLNDDTGLDSTYQSIKVIDQLGDNQIITTTKNP